jgi:hypothetical protein
MSVIADCGLRRMLSAVGRSSQGAAGDEGPGKHSVGVLGAELVLESDWLRARSPFRAQGLAVLCPWARYMAVWCPGWVRILRTTVPESVAEPAGAATGAEVFLLGHLIGGGRIEGARVRGAGQGLEDFVFVF